MYFGMLLVDIGIIDLIQSAFSYVTRCGWLIVIHEACLASCCRGSLVASLTHVPCQELRDMSFSALKKYPYVKALCCL